MRQPQRNNNNNNNRMRGRGRNKSPNPMSRNFESNGPDVKIRGNAGHIAEKYTTLARDAQSSGDRVMAENYLQHAEHYNRLVAAAQAQQEEKRQQESQQRENNQSSRGRQPDQNDDSSSDKSVDNVNDNADNNQASEVVASGDDSDKADGENKTKRANGRGRNQRPRIPKNTKRNDANDKSDDISDDASGLPQSLLGPVAAPSEPANADD